jgi:transposase
MGYTHGFDWSAMTEARLQGLVDEHGTLRAVAEHLGVSYATLRTQKYKYGWEIGFDRSRWKKKPSCLDPYEDEIRRCAEEEGMNCSEIAEALDLDVEPEQVRRKMHDYGIELATGEGAQPGEKNHCWRGGVDSDGYVRVYQPDHPHAKANGTVLEHRLVMEKKIGRYLRPEEVVHHIDHDKANNDPDNLMLFPNNGAHLAYEWGDPGWAEHQSVTRREGPQGDDNRPA